MKLSLKAVVAVSALLATAAVAAPIEKRDATSDRIAACFVGLLLTGAWPGSCQAAVAVDMGLIKSIEVNQMSMDFTPSNPWAPTTSSSSIVATMLGIPGISLPITSIRQHIIIVDNGVEIGNIETPWSPASVSGSKLTSSFASSTLNVFSSSHAAFSGFISSLSTKASHPVTLKGSVDAQMNLGPLGKRTISGIGFKATVPFLGLDNLKQVKYVYMVDTDMATQPGFMRLSSIINIVNPSKLTLSLGDVGFSTSYKGQPAGISTVSGLTLKPGDNYLLSLTSLDTKLSAAQQLMLDLPNADVPLTLTGYASSSQNPALNAGLATVSSQMVVPQNFQGLTMSQPPHKDWSLKTLPNTNTDGVVQVTATFQSPYYGLPLEFKDAQTVGYDSMAIIGSAAGISGVNLFRFMDNLTFSVSGTGSTTISFNVGLVTDFGAGSKAQWTDIVNYAKANGHLPIQFDWIAGIVLNNDSTYRYVDWGSIGTGLGDVNIAVGRDFESILGAFP